MIGRRVRTWTVRVYDLTEVKATAATRLEYSVTVKQTIEE